MIQRGITVVRTQNSTVEELAKQATALQQQLIGKLYSQAELDMVIRYRDEFRARQSTGRPH